MPSTISATGRAINPTNPAEKLERLVAVSVGLDVSRATANQQTRWVFADRGRAVLPDLRR
jgi:hypothetical protein